MVKYQHELALSTHQLEEFSGLVFWANFKRQQADEKEMPPAARCATLRAYKKPFSPAPLAATVPVGAYKKLKFPSIEERPGERQNLENAERSINRFIQTETII